MAGRVFILLCVFVYVSGTDVQETILKLRQSIATLQKQVNAEREFLQESQDRVDKLTKVFEDMRRERAEIGKPFAYVVLTYTNFAIQLISSLLYECFVF